jgi:hypothetical protein
MASSVCSRKVSTGLPVPQQMQVESPELLRMDYSERNGQQDKKPSWLALSLAYATNFVMNKVMRARKLSALTCVQIGVETF